MKARVIEEPYFMCNLKVGDVVEIIPGMETDAEGIWNVPAGKLVLCLKEDGTTEYISPKNLQYILPKFNSEDFSTGVITVEESKWSVFRRDAAKNILQVLIDKASDVYEFESLNKDVWCQQAIEWADELIKQLKQE